MNKLNKFIKKYYKILSIGLLGLFMISSIFAVLILIGNKEDEYHYYTMPNGTIIRYRGKPIVPDENGIITVPDNGASIILPN